MGCSASVAIGVLLSARLWTPQRTWLQQNASVTGGSRVDRQPGNAILRIMQRDHGEDTRARGEKLLKRIDAA